jgi:hypothetical protein
VSKQEKNNSAVVQRKSAKFTREQL